MLGDEPPPRPRRLAGVLPSVLAIGALAAVVLLLIGVFGQPEGDVGAGTTPSVTTPAATPVTPAPPVQPPGAPTPTAPPATPAPAPTPTVPVELPDITVVVMNSIGEAGLATLVTNYLGSLGWDMGGPADFATPLEVTTVYYPEGYEADAQALAAFAPGSGMTIAPVLPEFSADAITVVLGADAAGWTPPGSAPTDEPEPAGT